jgi:hypothetical protein
MSQNPFSDAAQPSQPTWTLPPPAAPQVNPFADKPYAVSPTAASVNPYAAPATPTDYRPVKAASFDGLWRQADVLVMHKLAPLPDVCLKTNQPATGRLKRNLSWHHPAIYALFLINWLIYLIVALIVQKKATIHIGLSDESFARRKRAMLLAWSVIGLSLLLFIGGIAMVDEYDYAALVILFAVVLFLVAAIWGLLAARMVVAKRMTDDYIWLKGVHPDFLAQLPEWTYNI